MDKGTELRLVTFTKDGKQMLRYVYDETPTGFFDKQTIGEITNTPLSLTLPKMKVTVEFTD